MGLQTMSNMDGMPEELPAGRGDPVYMAHAYLTKVPVPAIIPMIEAYTEPGDVVIDPFAGSGMTGVAAAMTGRRGRLSDISILGQHIGQNYVNLVDAALLEKAADEVVAAAKSRLGDIYAVPCLTCGRQAELAKTVWSVLVECGSCEHHVNYYRALEAASWHKPDMVCEKCSAHVSSRLPRKGEEPVIDYVKCECTSGQIEQAASDSAADISLTELSFPDVEITPDRQMYKASALGKNGYTTVASFYSSRNLKVLSVIRDEIRGVADDDIRDKLLFAFTACLTRASKRYQWSRQRPLNAANANYYVAPVFYEWSVFGLLGRKITAVLKADRWIRDARKSPKGTGATDRPDVTYEIRSAESSPLETGSADYAFTDPPFGSNLFYADMALFQEGWIGKFTDVTQEAVIDRSSGSKRTASRYETLLTDALLETKRVVKTDGFISMVFGNSSGAVWELVQRAVTAAGLEVVPEALAILDKGQRSVKGLASGFEDVATLDLVLTMRRQQRDSPAIHDFTEDEVVNATREIAESGEATSPSHLYLELLRRGFRDGWRLGTLSLKTITSTLIADKWQIDRKTGRLYKEANEPPESRGSQGDSPQLTIL